MGREVLPRELSVDETCDILPAWGQCVRAEDLGERRGEQEGQRRHFLFGVVGEKGERKKSLFKERWENAWKL